MAIENSIALSSPPVVNPSSNLSTSNTINPFIINENSPSVSMVIGKDISFNIGRIQAFINVSITVTSSRLISPIMDIPPLIDTEFIAYAAIATDTACMIRFLSIVLFWCVGLDSNQRSPKGDRFTVCCNRPLYHQRSKHSIA